MTDMLAWPNCAKGAATVTASALRVRAGPGLQYPQVGRLLAAGETVTVWAALPEWWLVQAADGITGWCSAKYLHAESELQP